MAVILGSLRVEAFGSAFQLAKNHWQANVLPQDADRHLIVRWDQACLLSIDRSLRNVGSSVTPE
jgi:hypothetical protein